MGFVRKRLLGRFPVVGRLTDVVLVSNSVLRLAHRKGLVSDETARRFGAADSSGGTGVSMAELAMVAGAILRLGRRAARRRKRG